MSKLIIEEVNKFKESIDLMIYELSRRKGFPVAAVFMDEKFNILGSSANSKSENKNETNPEKTHAEFKCYSIVEEDKKILKK